ncbi:MAG: Txe/YoeB family addiction module toxin [Paludibacteraceae bacterium]|nr:Txe/YoeB family addiction module toxin [Paludibacteraceae bacterium]
MIYAIKYLPEAEGDLLKLKRSEPAAFKKVRALLDELTEHPTTGTGHPHQLSGDRAGQWARSITKKHRLVYEIREQQVIVLVLAAYGHYDDK